MPDEIQNARILDERRTRPTCQIKDLELVPGSLAFASLGCKSTIRLGGFHHAVISSEFCEDFIHL
ncbi:MAG: hypothetical protein IJJ41_04410 [Clostridia bacterium]|nr:hypothetical protein [Clostridia bacterium]